ncbi:hypothetical protein CMU93_00625 [Elizabethkingia anophelis]|nr:hypothetical protein [Elizabethkingia anophelis]
MKILKIIIYYICFTFCLIQLLGWIFGPFIGVGAIYNAIVKTGFYINSNLYYRDLPLSEALGMEEGVFIIVNRFIAILYFLSILIVIGSIFLKKNKRIYLIMILLSFISIFILIILPLLLRLLGITENNE